MGEVCQDFGILTIDNFIHSNNFEDKVNWYKTKPINLEQNQFIELLQLDNVNNNNNNNEKDKKVKKDKKQ